MVRRLTTGMMALAFLLTLAWPLELLNRPVRSDPLPVRKGYARRLFVHTGAIVGLLVGAGYGAILVSRRAKKEYREAARRNLQALIEGEERE